MGKTNKKDPDDETMGAYEETPKDLQRDKKLRIREGSRRDVIEDRKFSKRAVGRKI